MSKLLLRNQNVFDYVDNDNKTLLVKKDMILTPGAKDLLRNEQIKILYEHDDPQVNDSYKMKPQEKGQELKATSSEEEKELKKEIKQIPLSDHIKLMLRNEFGILEEAEVQKIAKIVIEILRENGDLL